VFNATHYLRVDLLLSSRWKVAWFKAKVSGRVTHIYLAFENALFDERTIPRRTLYIGGIREILYFNWWDMSPRNPLPEWMVIEEVGEKFVPSSIKEILVDPYPSRRKMDYI
jgi:hypothetical protein